MHVRADYGNLLDGHDGVMSGGKEHRVDQPNSQVIVGVRPVTGCIICQSIYLDHKHEGRTNMNIVRVIHRYYLLTRFRDSGSILSPSDVYS